MTPSNRWNQGVPSRWSASDRGTVTSYFPPDVSSLIGARQFVREAARDIGLGRSDIDALVLVANELVLSAIEHEESEFRVELLPLGDSVRVEVWRPALTSDEASANLLSSAISARRRGLQIIEGLSRSWGADRIEGGGTIVWVEVPRTTGRRRPPLAKT